jgi:DNA-binding IclR family transcriptional regulator
VTGSAVHRPHTAHRHGLERELDRVRAQGWAATVEEYEIGLNALAVPLRDHDGVVVSAMSVSGPSYRLAPDSFPQVSDRLLEVAADVSRRLGRLS